MPYVVAKVNGKRFPFPKSLWYESDLDRWRGGPDRYEVINVVTRRRTLVGGGAGSAQRRNVIGRRAHHAEGSHGDKHVQRELDLFAENDGDLYRQMLQPIRKNLANKMANGTYVHARAVDAFLHFLDEAAKRYQKQLGDRTSWHVAFPILDRRIVAEEWAQDFEANYKHGEYNYLLNATATRRAIAASRLPKDRRQ